MKKWRETTKTNEKSEEIKENQLKKNDKKMTDQMTEKDTKMTAQMTEKWQNNDR